MLRLADGRRLGFAEYGDRAGRPVVYCHGFPASRLEARLVHDIAVELNLRILAPDRPGYGLSDFQPGRTLLDWPGDVAELCRQLGIARFALLGVSGGGPYALACAARLSAAVIACGLVCPLGPVGEKGLRAAMHWPARVAFGLARRFPRLALSLFSGPVAGWLRHHPQQALKLLTVSAPPADREVLNDPVLFSLFGAAISEALLQGGRGVAHDLLLYTRHWGFDLAGLDPPVLLWQGEKDETVPPSMAHFLAASLPHCQSRYFPREGHFSLPVRHARSILSALVAAENK